MGKTSRRYQQARGRIYNLHTIYRRLNGIYFNGAVKVRIEWGQSRGQRARRSREFGTYYFKERLIRIHPILDQAWVPLFVVESVVHHEMCHQVCAEQLKRGKRVIHTAEFRRQEREYIYFTEAEHWMKENLNKLLRPAPVVQAFGKVKQTSRQLELSLAA